VRERIQEWLQELIEEEVTEVLGRGLSERRAPVGGRAYRNGYGKPRRLTLSSGAMTVRRPRGRSVTGSSPPLERLAELNVVAPDGRMPLVASSFQAGSGN
jgi:transposase-like protein